MGFKIGDKVVCIKRGAWTHVNGNYQGKDPVYNDDYVVKGTDSEIGNPILLLEGFGCWYFSCEFRKVEPKKQTNKLSAKLLEEFKESEIIKEVDVIEKPNPVYN